MPLTFELDADTRIVYTRASDVLTDDDLVAHLEAIRPLFEDGTLDESWAQLADFEETAQFDVTTAGVRRLALENPWPEGAFRVIAAPTDLGFGLGRMYELLNREGLGISVGRSARAALELIEQWRAAGDE